jgi:hypothetical protein
VADEFRAAAGEPEAATEDPPLPDLCYSEGYVTVYDQIARKERTVKVKAILMGTPEPMPRNPTRGGRIRSTKAALRNFYKAYGRRHFIALIRMQYPTLDIPYNVDRDEATADIADYLFPAR